MSGAANGRDSLSPPWTTRCGTRMIPIATTMPHAPAQSGTATLGAVRLTEIGRAAGGDDPARSALRVRTHLGEPRPSLSGSRPGRIAIPIPPLVAFGTTDALRVAIGRACRDAGVPVFSPHDLRHRRISLLHHQGESWAEIGAKVGQRNISTTADTYTHVLMDYREVDRAKLLARLRTTHTPVHTPEAETSPLAATF